MGWKKRLALKENLETGRKDINGQWKNVGSKEAGEGRDRWEEEVEDKHIKDWRKWCTRY